MPEGPIMGLDIGRLLGVAIGEPGGVPRSSTVILAKPRGELAEQAGNLIAFLDQRFRAERPKLVAKEAPFSLAAFRDHAVSEAVVRSAYGLHCVVLGMCRRFGIPCHDAHESSVTKHFTGRGRHGGRSHRKRAILERCRLLGYVPLDCADEDRADACAVWDWACAHLAKVPPRELHLFGATA